MNTLIDLIAASAATHGDRPALILRSGLRDDQWSYRRLWASINAVARHLGDARGIRPGDRVLLCAAKNPQYVACLMGVMLRRAVPIPLDLGSPATLVQRVADDTEAAGIITDLPLELSGLPRYALDSMPYCDDKYFAEAHPAAEDPAEIVYTSGTTGKPKGVVLSHRNVIASVKAALALVPYRQPWRMLSLLPLSHMFEQTVGLFAPLALGATIHYGVSYQPAAIRKALQRYRINVMAVVPRLLTHMMHGIEHEVRRADRLRAWETAHRLAPYLPFELRRRLFRAAHRQLGGALEIVMCGGAYLPPEAELAWERLGVKVIQGYGATECAPLVAGNTLDRRIPGSVGKPVPGVQLHLSDDGEILASGPNVFSGYWRNETATREAFTEQGWYRTGDLATIDRDGNVYIKGRKKDMVVLPTGMNVFLEDIEAVLGREPSVRSCVVLDVTSPKGEVGFTAVVLAQEAGREEADLAVMEDAVKNANLQLAPHQRISGLALWRNGDFPRTSIGKLKRHEVRAWLEKQAARLPAEPGDAPAKEPSTFASLRRLLADLTGVPSPAITPDSNLNLNLGLSSLARVELALLVEDKFGVLIDDSDIAGVEKVSALVSLIDRGGSAAPGPEIPLWPLKAGTQRLRTLLQRLVLFPVHSLVARPFIVEGLEHVHELKSQALFIANHSSHVDTVSIIRALPASIRNRLAVAAAADYFFRIAAVGRLTSLFLNTFPFSREGAVRASLEHCGFLADQGWSVLIYPEGTRSATGELLAFKLGIGLLATELRLPVVPVAVLGGHDVLPKGRIIPRPGPVRVRFGAPLWFTEPGDPSIRAAELRQRVSELLARASGDEAEKSAAPRPATGAGKTLRE
jgi:long-chain acyl-CoA synthetase